MDFKLGRIGKSDRGKMFSEIPFDHLILHVQKCKIIFPWNNSYIFKMKNKRNISVYQLSMHSFSCHYVILSWFKNIQLILLLVHFLVPTQMSLSSINISVLCSKFDIKFEKLILHKIVFSSIQMNIDQYMLP